MADDIEGDDKRLNKLVAATVVILTVFMAISKVKDDNIVQAMQQSQADRLDHWNFYQARNIRQDVAAAEATQLRLAASVAAQSAQEAYTHAIAAADARAADESGKKDELRAEAEQDQKTYDALNYRDDQFDLSDALLALAISMMAVTALTGKEWLYWISLAPTAGGVLMGLAGLFSWHIHPDMLVRWLS